MVGIIYLHGRRSIEQNLKDKNKLKGPRDVRRR